MKMRLTATAQMPIVGFGTYLIGDDDAQSAVLRAIRAGYRHVDTAEAYGNERGVGVAIAAGVNELGLTRDEVFVTTKLWPGNAAWGQEPKTYDATIESLDASLARLELDYVDLYLIHAPSAKEQRLEQWRALVELKRLGKARAVGVSNYREAHIEEIRAAELPLPDANQIELHPWSQKPDLVAYLARSGITVIAYSSLLPLSTWRDVEGQESAKSAQLKAEGTSADSPFKVMARKYGCTEAQVLLRWGVQSGYAVLPKSTNPERLAQNIDLFSFEIDEDDMTAIASMDRGDGLAWSTGDPSRVA
jgi:2,5-diketo-D-gluconate reductase A